jgi:hypothetical protein
MVQVSWNGAYYHLPLYASTSAELETVQTLRDAYRDGRSVRLAARDLVFFEDRRVITAVRAQ